ncbi:MAG: thioredoxin family protein [Dehalococcoidia bacterium]|nr:MAG: thioredoxin family protein [Dehalococcoidia bacterium]
MWRTVFSLPTVRRALSSTNMSKISSADKGPRLPARSNRIVLILAFVALLSLALVAVYGRYTELKNQTTAAADRESKTSYVAPLPREIYHGPADAAIVLLEYFDLDCPYCKEFHEENEAILMRQFEGASVAFARRHMPLTYLHPQAELKAEALECTMTQSSKSREEVIDLLYTTAIGTIDEATKSLVGRFGLEEKAFTSCLAQGSSKEVVGDDKAKGAIQGVSATPTFVIFKDGVERARVVGNNGKEIYAALRLLVAEQ